MAKPLWIVCGGLLGFLMLLNHPLRGQSPSAGKDWSLIHGDRSNARYSTLNQIDTQTIKNLSGAWMSKQFESGAISRSAVVVQGGRMFVTAGSHVYSFDAKTGTQIWSYQTDSRPEVNPKESTIGATFAGHGLPDYQGVGVGEGLVFVGITDGRVIALDAGTGKLVWETPAGGDDSGRYGLSVSDAPTYSQGVVFVGVGIGDLGLRGRVVALDAKTGRELWHFMMVPGPGETGHDTWPKDTDAWKVGGAGVWHTGAVDADLGLVYFGGGSAVPIYGGELRGGDNLFSNSVVALDIKTGKLRWYYQVQHHEIWDADIAVPVVLYDANMGGRIRKGIAAMRSDGYLFLLDRETGKPLIPIEERPVPQSAFQKTARTQPFPVGADSVLPECSTWKDKVPAGFVLQCTYLPHSLPPPSTDPQNVLAPGFNARVTPFSYSPQTQYFYAQGAGNLAWRKRTNDPFNFYTNPNSRVPVIPENLRPGFIVAIDSRTDKIVWKKEVRPSLLGRGGFLVTAGGLMFHGSADGNLQAFDAKTGDLLWQFQTGSGGGGGPAATYEIDGEQYVAYVAGPTIWSFKMGGTLKPLPAPNLPPPAEGITGPIEDTDRINTASLLQNNGDTGTRYFVDEFLFGPYRARVEVGTRVMWKNNGVMTHTIVALDGSWKTSPLYPTDAGSVVFDKPGTYTYICKDHPWSYGQIIVVPKKVQSSSAVESPQSSSDSGGELSFAAQVSRGKVLYAKACSSCHVDNLSGRDPAPALAGSAFLLRWEGRMISDLFERIRTTMPLNASDRLPAEAALDVATYILQANSFSVGEKALKVNSPELSSAMKQR